MVRLGGGVEAELNVQLVGLLGRRRPGNGNALGEVVALSRHGGSLDRNSHDGGGGLPKFKLLN